MQTIKYEVRENSPRGSTDLSITIVKRNEFKPVKMLGSEYEKLWSIYVKLIESNNTVHEKKCSLNLCNKDHFSFTYNLLKKSRTDDFVRKTVFQVVELMNAEVITIIKAKPKGWERDPKNDKFYYGTKIEMFKRARDIDKSIKTTEVYLHENEGMFPSTVSVDPTTIETVTTEHRETNNGWMLPYCIEDKCFISEGLKAPDWFKLKGL